MFGLRSRDINTLSQNLCAIGEIHGVTTFTWNGVKFEAYLKYLSISGKVGGDERHTKGGEDFPSVSCSDALNRSAATESRTLEGLLDAA